MKILSLDQSTRKTGYCYDADQGIQYGLLTAKNKEEMYRRIKELVHRARPELVAIESVSHQSNNQTMITLAQLQGLIEAIAIENNMDFLDVSPNKWRTLNDIPLRREKTPLKRQELKEIAVRMVTEEYGEIETDDVAEAILIHKAVKRIASM